MMSINKKKNSNLKIEFSKILCALIAGALFIYAIYAGFAFYSQVSMYYESVNNAIQAGTEYVSISQPDPTLAVTCVTCILASFLTYCLYQFGLKNSLNQNRLKIDGFSGLVDAIVVGSNDSNEEEDTSKIEREELKRKTKKTDNDEDDFQETVAG